MKFENFGRHVLGWIDAENGCIDALQRLLSFFANLQEQRQKSSLRRSGRAGRREEPGDAGAARDHRHEVPEVRARPVLGDVTLPPLQAVARQLHFFLLLLSSTSPATHWQSVFNPTTNFPPSTAFRLRVVRNCS